MSLRIVSICADLADPFGRDLQERMLESMLLMEHHRGILGTDVGYSFDPSEYSAECVSRLAEALALFIRKHVSHPDVSSAIWALGKLYDEKYVPLLRLVLENEDAYSQEARDQAWCALDNLGLAPKEDDHEKDQ